MHHNDVLGTKKKKKKATQKSSQSCCCFLKWGGGGGGRTYLSLSPSLPPSLLLLLLPLRPPQSSFQPSGHMLLAENELLASQSITGPTEAPLVATQYLISRCQTIGERKTKWINEQTNTLKPARNNRVASTECAASYFIYGCIVQELRESRGGRPGLSVLTSLLAFVDVKNYSTVLWHWSQLVPNMSTDIWGH